MIQIKSASEIKILRENANILSEIVGQVADAARPGVSTIELDELAAGLIEQCGCQASIFGVSGIPCCDLCIDQ